MSRIVLPGNEKFKKILLLILVIIAIGLLFREKIGSANNSSVQQKEIISKDIQENDSDVAKKDSEKVDVSNVNINSTKENELYNEAYTLFFSHKYSDAIKKSDIILSEFPNSALGYNIRGIAKAYNGDFNGGMSDIDKALSIDNSYGYARFNKALTYELYGNMDEALKWYNKALEIEDYVWSYYGIASIYGRKGDIKNTVTYLSKAIQLDSGVKDVAKDEHDFDPVRESQEFKKLMSS